MVKTAKYFYFLAVASSVGLLVVLVLFGCASTVTSPSDLEDQILAAKMRQLSVPSSVDRPPGFKSYPPSAATKAQKAQYQKGQNLLKSRNYHGAAEVFREILYADPQAPLAPNACYWLGECYYAQGRYEDAWQEFNRCYQTYPRTAKAPDALLKRAYCHNMLYRSQEAMRDLDLLLKTYPRSPAAGLIKSGRIKFRQPS